ncbi:MAG: hypothetical protein IPG86_03775 [Chitinophagaceae bacterium]|nr:hypothetical protein [Chitinophagaceae bacterium]
MLIAVKLYERLMEPLFTGWLFMLFFLIVFFYGCRNIIAMALLKLHELFIQRNYFRFSGRMKRE